MNSEDREALLQRWCVEGDALTVLLPPWLVFTLAANLQLALRHPANQGHSAHVVRRFLRDLQDRMPPAIAVLSREGDDPTNDVLVPNVSRN